MREFRSAPSRGCGTKPTLKPCCPGRIICRLYVISGRWTTAGLSAVGDLLRNTVRGCKDFFVLVLVLVLVLERLKRWPEVEAGPDFKISGRTRCRQRNAFRIEHEHEHEKILASAYRVPLKITNRR